MGNAIWASTDPPLATATPPSVAITALAATAMSSGSRPNTTRLCVSWDTVVAMAPSQVSPQPLTRAIWTVGGTRP